MPRANRHIQSGCLYHLTHRCHNRVFLFRFAIDRTEYRKRLRLALREFGVSMLNYCVTSNHTHLLVEAAEEEQISQLMQKLEGEFAGWYNRRKRRSGAFWSDRFHCTMVDSGRYAWKCMVYIDLNMVRAGVVQHPGQWGWCGYDELIGRRKRYRLLDHTAVLRWQNEMSRGEFVQEYRNAIQEAIVAGQLERNPIWTESIAVGSRPFIKRIRERLTDRVKLYEDEVQDQVWTLREAGPPYVRFLAS